MRLEHKKLPRGWLYLITIRQIKELIHETGADVKEVQFTGTGRRPAKITAGLYRCGNLDARVYNRKWCFSLQFCALPAAVLPNDVSSLSDRVIADIRQFLTRPLEQTLDSTVKPEHRILFFRRKNDELIPNFSTRTSD